MASNTQQQEEFELKPLEIIGTQDEQSCTEEASMVQNERQHGILVMDPQQDKLLYRYVYSIEIIHSTFLRYSL